jgi:hypothetical protein
MLDKEQILKNKEIFLDVNKTYDILTQELLEFLGENLFLSPATTNLSMFGCYPGGLMNHMINSCRYSVKMNDLLPQDKRIDKKDIVRCSFILHIGKTFLYVDNKNDWAKKTLGKIYDFNPELMIMKGNHRSVYYANSYGVKLSEIEYNAIITQDNENNENNDDILAFLLKKGVEMSILIEKNGNK